MSVTESKKTRSLTTSSQPDSSSSIAGGRVALLSELSPSIATGIEPLPNKHDIAHKYRVSVRTVDRWVVQRKIPFLLLGERMIRFRWADVERAINRMTVREMK